MKKIIITAALILSVLVILSSCGKSEAVKDCQKKIDAIGEVSLEKGSLIEEAESAFMLLPAEETADVKNAGVLTSAREEYDALKAFADKVEALSEKIDKAFVEYGIGYAEIMDEYNALKESIPEETKDKYAVIDTLTEKLAEFDTMAEKAQKSAVSYVKGFLELNKDKEVEITEIGCIAQISEETTYCMFALKYTEGTEEKKVYSAARFANTPSVESMLDHAADFYKDAPASESTDALLKGNVVIDTPKVLSEAE